MKTRNRFVKVTSSLLAALTFIFALAVARDAGAVFVRAGVAYRPRPVARGVAFGAAAAVTAVAIGSVVRSLPPSCQTVMVGNVPYHNCSGTWYQPQGATYIVVQPPQ